MNVSRFQIALNHEDPNVIISGLKSFSDQILKEHDAIYAFGYNGRSVNSLLLSSATNILHPYYSKYDEMPIGLLLSYLQSSPQIEELFVLWNLPGYSINKDLCCNHMICVASILFCAHKDEVLCNYIINRIISEYCKSMLTQLGSGNQNVIHSTLGLCVSMARVSKQNACDTYQKIMISNNLFATLLQRGKTVTWSTRSDNDDDIDDAETISTDSRLLIIIWFFLIMDAADSTIAAEIASHNSILRRITNGIHKDPTYTIIITLMGIKLVRGNSTTLSQTKIVDSAFQDRILELYGHEDDDVQCAAHNFLIDHCKYIINNLKTYSRNDNSEVDNSNNSGNMYYVASQLIRNLQPHIDLRHRTIQMIILTSQPSLISICISSLNISRDPQSTIDYLSSISQLIYLIQNVSIDKNLKSLVKNAATKRCTEVELNAAIYKLVHSVFPNDFQKNNFTKILLHQNAMVQRMGLILVKVIAQRISRTIPAKNVHKDAKFEAAMAVCLEEHLPDMQILVNIWNKYFNRELQDNDKNDYLLTLVLKTMESIINIFPSSISDTTFDLLRLLDDFVYWNLKDNAEQCLASVNLKSSSIALNLVNLLRTATLHKRCKWFGTKDDIIKSLTNIIVTEDWSNSIKRDPLAKLLVLANSDNQHVKSDASNLFRMVLNQTEIFENISSLEFEMLSEANIWHSCQSTGDNSILLSSTILRIAYHWSTDYMITADEIRQQISSTGYLTANLSPNDFNITAIPFSSALYCAMSLCSTNFSVLIDYLPNHIKSHLTKMNAESSLFLQKFNTGFRTALQTHILQILTLCTIRARDRISYIREILLSIKALSKFDDNNSIIDIIEKLNSLISVYESRDSKLTPMTARVILSNLCGIKNVSDNDDVSTKKRKLKDKSVDAEINFSADETFDNLSFKLAGHDPRAISSIAVLLAKLVSNDLHDESQDFSGIWLFVVGLHLSISDSISMQLLSWIKSCFEFTISNMNEKDIRIEQQASFLSQSLELLIKMIKLVNIDINPVKKSKRARKNNDDDDVDSKLQIISQICTILEAFSVDLIFSSSCNHVILTVLDSELITYEFKNNPTEVGALIRKIICAAGSVQFRRYNIEKRNLVIHNLWRNIAKILDSYDISNKNDLILFTLGWALQSFLDDEKLKTLFVSKIFDIPEGYSALELSTQNLVKQNNARHFGLLISTLGRLSNVSSTILLSAQASAINKSMLEYVMQPSMKLADKKLMNSMMGILVGFNNITINSHNTSEFSFYCDNLLFFDPKLSNERATVMFDVTHKFSTIITLCAFERMKMNHEIKPVTSFQSVMRNVCPGVMNTSVITMEGIRELSEQRSIIAEDILSGFKDILIDLLKSISSEDDLFRCIIGLSKNKYLSNEIFFNNFTIVLLKSSDQLKKFQSKASIAVSFLACILLTIMKENKKIDSFIRTFVDTLCEIFVIIFDESLQSLDIDSERYCDQHLRETLELINLLLFIDSLVSESNWANNENVTLLSHSLQTKRILLKKKLNKFIKICLKRGITKGYVIDYISSFVCRMQKMNKNMILWNNLFSVEDGDFYQPQMLLQMIVSHSMFLDVLCKDSDSSISIIGLLLILTHHAVSNREDTVSSDEFMVKSLLSIYTGKMTKSDRLILRIFNNMHAVQRCGELCTLELTESLRKSSISDLKYASSSRSWITSTLSQATVYSTLSSFPFWRSLIPQPLVIEGHVVSARYNDEMRLMIQGILGEWENDENNEDNEIVAEGKYTNEELDDYNSDRSSVEADSDVDGSDDSSHSDVDSGEDNADFDFVDSAGKKSDFKNLYQLLSNHENEVTMFFDHLVDCSDKIYDPSYWLPVLHYSLQQHDLSMRQLSNSGAISLVIATLGSCCPLLRTIALSCLQHILKYLRRQDRTKDAAFRERPQLLLLINFIRNSISYHDKGDLADSSECCNICPRLPPTIAITLGRAAMHLLQPSNDLFSAINKYLLSRPYCDFKDLPMWEILVINADVISEQSKRLTELRLLRDGLNSKQDHLNLCRKNGYSKLMLMFPLLVKDSKVSHAIVDILDKVLSLQYSARYLIQRCDIIFWLQQLIVPFKNLDIESQANMIDGSRDSNANGRVPSKNLIAIPTYILPRLLGLLRRTIGACYFLKNSNEINNSIYSDINSVMHSILDSVALINHHGYSYMFSAEFLHSLILCLWEFALTSHACNFQLSWGIEKIIDLALTIANDDKKVVLQKDTKNDFLTSTLALLSFNQISSTIHSNPRISQALSLLMTSMVDRIGIPSNQEDGVTYYSILKFSKNAASDYNSKQHNFFTSLNIFFEDHVELPSSTNPEFHSFVDFNYNMQRSWHEFSRLKLDDMELPTHVIDTKSVLMLTTKAMLHIISSLIRDGEDVSLLVKTLDETIAESMIRWTLSMSNLFLNSNDYFETSSKASCISDKLKIRIFSIIDNGINVSQYTKSFCEFQLLLRLTFLSIISLEYNHLYAVKDISISFRRAMVHVLKTLNNSKIEMNDARETTIFLLREINDGMILWNNTNNRAIIVEICLLALDLSGALISYMDKYKTNNNAASESYDFLHYLYDIGPKRLDTLCNLFKSDVDEIMDIQSAGDNDFSHNRINETKFNSRFFSNQSNTIKSRKNIDNAINMMMMG